MVKASLWWFGFWLNPSHLSKLSPLPHSEILNDQKRNWGHGVTAASNPSNYTMEILRHS